VTRLGRPLVGIGVVSTLGLLASIVPFLWPAQDRMARADAVFVLSGDYGERLGLATELMARGVAPTLVFDGTRDRAIEDQMCAEDRQFEVVCLRPEPDSTREEARAGAALAGSRQWRRIIVVTSSYHVTRSRLLFERCFDGTVDVVGLRPAHDRAVFARLVMHEWLAVGHALTIQRGC